MMSEEEAFEFGNVQCKYCANGEELPCGTIRCWVTDKNYEPDEWHLCQHFEEAKLPNIDWTGNEVGKYPHRADEDLQND